MNDNEPVKEGGNQYNIDDNPLKVKCPFCGEYTTIILDPKQISDEKTDHICLICGQTFEYINRREK